MGAALSLLILSLPTLLVGAAFYLWREYLTRLRLAFWLVLGAVWAISAWFWASYSRQQDDVGLMVEGILAGATTISALVATLVAMFLLWRR